MRMIGDAISNAILIHKDQKDKVGKPYIFHPLTVMFNVLPNDEDHMVVAVLHDALEDCNADDRPWLFRYLDTLPKHISEAIYAITRLKGETYKCYLQRVKGNPMALQVKKSDILHNMDRMAGLPKCDADRLTKKYKKAWKTLFASEYY